MYQSHPGSDARQPGQHGEGVEVVVVGGQAVITPSGGSRLVSLLSMSSQAAVVPAQGGDRHPPSASPLCLNAPSPPPILMRIISH